MESFRGLMGVRPSVTEISPFAIWAYFHGIYYFEAHKASLMGNKWSDLTSFIEAERSKNLYNTNKYFGA